MTSYYRVIQLANGRWKPQVSRDGETWHGYTYRSYARRGDAVRIVNMERIQYGEGRWWVEGEQVLSTDEQTRLAAWKEQNRKLIASETSEAISGLSDEEQARGAFIKWLIAHDRMNETVTLHELGLEQLELSDA